MAVALMAAVAAALARAIWQPSGSAPPDGVGLHGRLDVFDAGGSALRFPGGILELGEGGSGGWLVVYQRTDPVPTVYAREQPDLLGRFGPEVRVSNFARAPGYDPGAVRLDDGTVLVTWSSRGGVDAAVRLGPGRYGPPGRLFTDPGGRVAEQTVSRVLGRSFILYDFHPSDRVQAIWDLRIRFLEPGPVPGPPFTVVAFGPGPGVEGEQRRATAASTGRGRELLAVWNQHPDRPRGPRTIAGAISPDLGVTWGAPFEVARLPRHDLVNPFAILAGPHDLRVYFTQDRHVPALGYVRSTDGGRTWSPPIDVLNVPPGARSARVVIADDSVHGLVAFVAGDHLTKLATYVLASKEELAAS